MLPCFCINNRSDPVACVPATQTEEGFHVIEAPLYRIETVRRFRAPKHTAYRDLRRCARQHQMRSRKHLCEETDPPPAGSSCPNGPPNARPTAGLVLRYEAGCFIIPRCRGPPPRLTSKIRRRRLSHGTAV